MVFPFRLPGVNYYGRGAVQYLAGEIQKERAKRVFLISDKGVAGAGLVDKIKNLITEAGAEVIEFLDVEAEPSVENVELAVKTFQEAGCDFIVGLGGGSPMDVSKAVSVVAVNGGSILDYVGIGLVPKPGVPFILIPTTSGTGSEVTQNAIFTDKQEQLKKGVVTEYFLPKAAIVDSDLTMSAPPKITAATGMDALTHAIESYTAPKATPQTDLYALEAIRLIAKSLRRAVAYGADSEARENMALGSVFAGISLANAGVGAVHALAYPLGGQFGVPHGVANALLLPYVMEFNIVGHVAKFAGIAEAMGENVAGKSKREAAFLALKAVRELSQDVGIPQKLSEVGVTESDIEGLATATMNVTRLLGNNPRKVTLEDARNIFTKAL
ncbi:iron-containing alcohol dehydrogenase [Desulfoscipio geothermicus]|uniref:Iron-containing alcohol dehydrogenase n=1 Tax=Desulfoscipio geothermicus DSM 3669 TaxID=1121426 RepID=A0A1I6DW70_9FIRM|nr:iron-containing alcohol dehydrogenase [Desulfoscipio geothermicus]SFR09685.1 Iron-containing alcohol dehydrogenase [Desulfoscipio geothermicus DSM 3669]